MFLWHVVTRQSVYGSLRNALRGEEEKIIFFPDFFGEGPIQHILQEDGLIKRVDWLTQAYLFDDKDKKDYEHLFRDAMHRLESIPEGEQVLLWTSENAAEQFCLRLAVKILAQKSVSIYISNTFYNMLALCEGKDTRIEIRNSGEVSAKQFQDFVERKMYSILLKETQENYINELTQWLESDSLVRTWVNGQIRFDKETRDDGFIIQYAKDLQTGIKENYIKAPRLIGQVIGMSEYDITDTWINYRLRSLIDQKVFLFDGDMSEMRKYRVRLNDELTGD